jgi:putative transposase
MKQTIQFKLILTPAQHQALLETLHTFNAACNFLGEQVFAAQTTNVFELQERTEEKLREQFKLPPHLTFRAIFSTCERYKRRRQSKPVFHTEEAIVIDEQIASFQGLTRLSLLTIAGRMQVSFLVQHVRRASKQAIHGQTFLRYSEGHFFLEVTLESSQGDVPVASSEESAQTPSKI